jgi:hypothetical protein
MPGRSRPALPRVCQLASLLGVSCQCTFNPQRGTRNAHSWLMGGTKQLDSEPRRPGVHAARPRQGAAQHTPPRDRDRDRDRDLSGILCGPGGPRAPSGRLGGAEGRPARARVGVDVGAGVHGPDVGRCGIQMPAAGAGEFQGEETSVLIPCSRAIPTPMVNDTFESGERTRRNPSVHDAMGGGVNGRTFVDTNSL